jgi:hypothetical protein
VTIKGLSCRSITTPRSSPACKSRLQLSDNTIALCILKACRTVRTNLSNRSRGSTSLSRRDFRYRECFRKLQIARLYTAEVADSDQVELCCFFRLIGSAQLASYGFIHARIVAQNESTTRTSSLVSTMRSLFSTFCRLTPSISVILNHRNWQSLITISCLFFYKKVKQSSI